MVKLGVMGERYGFEGRRFGCEFGFVGVSYDFIVGIMKFVSLILRSYENEEMVNVLRFLSNKRIYVI